MKGRGSTQSKRVRNPGLAALSFSRWRGAFALNFRCGPRQKRGTYATHNLNARKGRKGKTGRKGEGEAGSGTLLVVGLAGLACTCAFVLAVSAVILGERTRLDAVGAVSALAGADVSATALWEDVGDRPCITAEEVARSNGAVLESCEVVGADTRVIVSVHKALFGFNVPIRARARAGPLTENPADPATKE